MTDPQLISMLAGGFIIINAGTQIGVRIICDRLLNTNGKTCSKHISLESKIEMLEEAHKENTMQVIINNAVKKALKENGIK